LARSETRKSAAFYACVPLAQAQDMGAKQAIAPSGTLRVTFLGGNPTQGKVEARLAGDHYSAEWSSGSSGKPEGARGRYRVRGHRPDTRTEVDFSQPYLLGWSSCIVPVGSALRSAKDVDRAGIRVAANAGTLLTCSWPAI